MRTLGGTGDPLPRLLGVERDPKWTAKLVPRGEVKVTGANAPGASEADPARAFGSPDVSVNVTRASGDDPSSANATAGSVFGAPSPSPSPAEAAKRDPELDRLRADAEEIQTKISGLRTSVEAQRKASETALRESLSRSKERIAAAGRVPVAPAPAVSADKTAGAVAGSWPSAERRHLREKYFTTCESLVFFGAHASSEEEPP